MDKRGNCEYCGSFLHEDYHDVKYIPGDLPDDIPDRGYDVCRYHSWCFKKVVEDERQEIAYKHGAG